jgi:hypothetical protein
VLIVAAVAAYERRKTCVVDITGAYLNAGIGSQVILMRLDKPVAAVYASLDPTVVLEKDGTALVRLILALYGCIESGKNWYEEILKSLVELGFIPNPYDKCVLNRGKDVTVVLYVDDLFISAIDDNELSKFLSQIRQRFNEITVNQDKTFTYLGMLMDLSKEGKLIISMNGYVKECMTEYQISGTAPTPATKELFEVGAGELLDKDKKEAFHSRVAKLLYLAKRARPDILVSVSYLSTRVQEPTSVDWKKLDRVLRYLNGTPNLGIAIEPDKDLTVTAFIDAAFAVHGDARSHTGAILTLGSGPIYVKSSKQKINTKSSTEAELIAVSDTVGQVLWTRHFMEAQGYSLKPARIKQDNMSTMRLLNNGFDSADRTRHIHIRHFFVKEKIDDGEVTVEYEPTESMIADMMTKPLTGEAFIKLRDMIMINTSAPN